MPREVWIWRPPVSPHSVQSYADVTDTPPQPALSPQLENAHLPVFLLPCILDLGGHPGMSGLIHIPSHFLRKHQPASGCPREMVASRGSCALTLPRLSVFSDPPHSTAPLLVLIVTFYHALVGPGVASINPHCPTTANFLQKVCSDPLTPSPLFLPELWGLCFLFFESNG